MCLYMRGFSVYKAMCTGCASVHIHYVSACVCVHMWMIHVDLLWKAVKRSAASIASRKVSDLPANPEGFKIRKDMTVPST